MKIAVAGKGGSGKTTIAGTLARTLGRRDLTVVAIDADPNPNLALSLGLEPEVAMCVAAVPHEFAFHSEDEHGQYSVGMRKSPEDIVAEYGFVAPDGVTLLMVGRVEPHQAGAG